MSETITKYLEICSIIAHIHSQIVMIMIVISLADKVYTCKKILSQEKSCLKKNLVSRKILSQEKSCLKKNLV